MGLISILEYIEKKVLKVFFSKINWTAEICVEASAGS